ncbi:MAG: helix-turn-helix domain-containing protein [Acidimicrobiales bacterium]
MSNAVVVRWPAEQQLRRTLRAAGVPRLLVIDAGYEPPLPLDPLEDWVGPDAGEDEVRFRLANLAVRGEPTPASGPVVEVGDILRHRGRWIALAPSETPIVRALVDAFDRCVPLGELGVDVDDPHGRGTFHTHVHRIRRRIAPLDLAIETVRGQGLVLTERLATEAGPQPAAAP